MNLNRVVANAVHRSPTPEQFREPLYREARTAYPGSGILTPDVYAGQTSANTTPPVLEMSSLSLPNGQSLETRFRLNSMGAGRQRLVHDGMGPSGEAMNAYHFHHPGVMMDPMHAQYVAGLSGSHPPPM